MERLRKRSEELTGLLEKGLTSSRFYVPPASAGSTTKPSFTIITPPDPASRGAQLSLLFLPPGSGLMQKAFDGMKRLGIIGDERRPDVIRLAPAPIYNNEDDVQRAVDALEKVLKKLAA
jgi:kynureninase